LESVSFSRFPETIGLEKKWKKAREIIFFVFLLYPVHFKILRRAVRAATFAFARQRQRQPSAKRWQNPKKCIFRASPHPLTTPLHPDVSALINEQQGCPQQTQRMPRRRNGICGSFSLNAGEPNWAGTVGEKG
jgi:hypothetical protein